jgi:hypothetical protein
MRVLKNEKSIPQRALLILMSAFLLTVFDVNGQITRRPVKKLDKKEEKNEEFKDRISGDIKLGNLGFFQNLYLSGKANAGYKFADYFTAGLGFKVFYTQIFIPAGPDNIYTDLGGFLYARGKIFNNFYLQAEYHLTSFDYVSSLFPGELIDYPSAGAGYASGSGNWRFGAEVNFNFNELARDYQGSVVEYWVGAYYNF